MKKRIILIIMILIFGLLCFYFGRNLNMENMEGYYIEQGYSFKNPDNWNKTEELGPLAFVNNSEDNGENPFKSYIFFIKDDLKGRTSEQYFNYIKDQIKSSSESMEIIEEKNEGSSHIIYIKTVQNEVSYIVGTAFIKGIDDTYLVVSLNTLESNLDKTKLVFEKVYKSFRLR